MFYRRNPEPCDQCGGLTYIITGPQCNWCSGTGEHHGKCIKCFGSGECVYCKGVGFKPEQRLPERPCARCTPSPTAIPGSIAALRIPGKCQECQGKGRKKGYGSLPDRDCYLCGGTGICTNCDGTNRSPPKIIPEETCLHCKRTGKCPACMGLTYTFCRRQTNEFWHAPCDLCGVCEYCRGLGVANKECYACRGTGEQPTKEERDAELARVRSARYAQCLKNLRLHGIENIRVDLFSERKNKPSPPDPNVPPNPWTNYPEQAMRHEQEMMIHESVPDYQTHLLVAENIPLYEALLQPNKFRNEACEAYGYPLAVFSDFLQVYQNDNHIGELRDTHSIAEFFYTGGSVAEFLLIAAITDKGTYEDIPDAGWASYAEHEIKSLVEGTNLEVDDVFGPYFKLWRSILAGLPLSRYSDGHLSVLNPVRALAFRLYRNITVKGYSFAY